MVRANQVGAGRIFFHRGGRRFSARALQLSRRVSACAVALLLRCAENRKG